MTNIYAKLAAAREEFHKQPMKKSGTNKFAGYDYFELKDFVLIGLEIMKKHGLCPVVSFPGDGAEMRIFDTESQCEPILISSPMPRDGLGTTKDGKPKGTTIQNLGASQTYLRRYLWLAALEILENDAIDGTAGNDNQAATKAPKLRATQGALESLPEEEQEYLKELAEQIKEMTPVSAFAKIEFENLDADQKAALWSLLNSKTRTAIKFAKDQLEADKPQQKT